MQEVNQRTVALKDSLSKSLQKLNLQSLRQDIASIKEELKVKVTIDEQQM